MGGDGRHEAWPQISIDGPEVDDDDAWQEPKSTRQIGGNIVDKEREELDEQNLYRSCVNAT